MAERRNLRPAHFFYEYLKTPWSVSTTKMGRVRGEAKIEDQLEWLTHAAPRTLNAVIDGIGDPITAGFKGDVVVDFDCEVTAWALLADVSGSAVVDIWRAPYADFPPTDADSITASSLPTLVAESSARDEGLDGWSVDIDAGDVLRFNVDSASAVSQLTLALRLLPR